MGHLEPLRDFEHGGETILASRLGYRITARFVQTFFGRIFDNPGKVFDEEILRPELQDKAAFIDGVKNIVQAQERVAKGYLEDGSIEDACPPLRALLMIMASGSFEGKGANDPGIRAMFTREYLLASDWYRRRLETKQRKDIALWRRHLAYLDGYGQDAESELDLAARRWCESGTGAGELGGVSGVVGGDAGGGSDGAGG